MELQLAAVDPASLHFRMSHDWTVTMETKTHAQLQPCYVHTLFTYTHSYIIENIKIKPSALPGQLGDTAIGPRTVMLLTEILYLKWYYTHFQSNRLLFVRSMAVQHVNLHSNISKIRVLKLKCSCQMCLM